MNDPQKGRGRPRKHLEDEHHFRTSDDAVAAGAPPAPAESDQAGELEPQDSVTSAELIHETVVENTADYSVIPDAISLPKESPVEEKIHDLIEEAKLNGWRTMDSDIVINLPPRNGLPVKVSENTGDGVVAFWKRIRAFANPTKRWKESGAWYDFHTGQKIPFEPKYWKERY